MVRIVFVFLLLFSHFALAQATSSLRYEGVLQGGAVSTGTSTQSFTVTIDRPDCPASTLDLTPWTNASVTVVDGAFTLNPTFSTAALQNALNPASTFSGCSPSTYSPRRLKITWNTAPAETFYIPLDDSPRATFSNVAANANAIGGVSVQPTMSCATGNFLKYNSGLTRLECQPLAASDIPTLSASVISSGTFSAAQMPAPAGDISGTFSTMSVDRIRGTSVSATAPTTNQVLKYNGTAWAPAADDAGTAVSDASYLAKGVVQIATDAATSGLTISSGVLSMVNVTSPNTIGTSTEIPRITFDSKGRITGHSVVAPSDVTRLSLAGGTMTGTLNMGAQPITNAASVSAGSASIRDLILNDADNSNNVTIRTPTSISPNYTLTLPLDDGSNGQVLATDGAGILSWITPGGLGALTSGNFWLGNASNVPTPVLMSGEATMSNAGVVNVTIGADSITSGILPVERGGTGTNALPSNNLLISNGTGTEVSGFFCSIGDALAFTAGGDVFCEPTGGANQLARFDGLNNLTVPTSLIAAGIAAPAVSSAGHGKIYFDSTTNQFRVSQNGGAYTNLITPLTPAGTNSQIQFNNAGNFGGASNLYWDNSNSRLGLGTILPQENMVIHSTAASGTSLTVSTTGLNSIQTANINLLTRNNTGATIPAFTSAQTKGWQFYGLSDSGSNPNSLGLDYFDGTTWSTGSLFFRVNGGANDIRMGIGTNDPQNDVSLSKPNKDTILSVSNSQTSSVDRFPAAIVENHLGATIFNGVPKYILRSSRGSELSPTATGFNDRLGRVSAQGYGGGSYADSGIMEFYATEAFTGSARGTAIRFFTTSNATTTATQRMVIDQDGAVNMSGPLNARSYSTPNWNNGGLTFNFINGGFQTVVADCSVSTLTASNIPDGGRLTVVITSSGGACASVVVTGLTVRWKNGTAPTAGVNPGAMHKYEFIRAGTNVLAEWGAYN